MTQRRAPEPSECPGRPRPGALLGLLTAVLLLALPLAGRQTPSGVDDPAEASARERFQQAVQSVRAGDLEAATGILEPLTEDPATTPQARALLGSLYIELDRPADALEVLAPLTEGPDATAAALYNAGRAALMLGRVQKGADYLERSVDRQPGTPAARTLGLLREREGRPGDAVRLLGPWVRRNPDDVNARLVATRAALHLGRLDEAERFLSDLPQSEPGVRLLWGRLLLLQSRPYGALAMLRPVVAGDAPETAGLEARLSMAEAYLALGEAEAARSLLAPVRELRPEHPGVRNLLERLKRP